MVPVQPAPPAGDKAGWRRFVAIPGGQPARKVEQPEEPVPPVVLPLLGKVPAVRNRRWRREIEAPRSVFQAKAHLVDVIDKPRAGFAEAIAALRAALSHGAGDNPRRRIMVLGLQSQAGATTIALNLALDAALAGQPTLLVDAGDGPLALTRIFAPDARSGFEEVVGGSRTLARAILKDEGSDLAFLPRSHRPDLSAVGSLETGLFGAAQRFGPVIIDATAGSLLARRFAEAVDDILVVSRQAKLSDADAERLRAQLGANAAKLRGIVTNEA